MENPRPLLAYGHFSRATRAQLEVAASESGFSLAAFGDVEAASAHLDQHPPRAVLVDTEARDAELMALSVRGGSEHARVPILALTPGPATDLSFGDAFSWGGDDAVNLRAPRQLVRRLRALPMDDPSAPPSARGSALVVETDRKRRTVLGRVLRNAGYAVDFGVDRSDLASLSGDKAPALLVVGSEVSGVEPDAVAAWRAAGVTSTIIVSAAPRELKGWTDALGADTRAAAVDGFAPPENVLFLANDLANVSRTNQRASARLLYGTTVAFRGAGRDEDDYGFSYNVSAGGLYVRTLAPPEDNAVWIELSPPRTERRVRLVGEVVWRRGLSHGETATVPPGFGVKIVDGAKADMEAWHAGYAAFRRVVG